MLYAEPNWIYTSDATSNDTYFVNGTLWGMQGAGTQYGSQAAVACAANHTNCSNGVDDDDDGYVDDVYGWDSDRNDQTVFDRTGDDHGTHVAGTIGGVDGGGFSQALQDAIDRANVANILFIAAAGNEAVNCESASCYPAEHPNANVISVASIKSTGATSSFSNYGSTTLDLGAPGSAATASLPTAHSTSSIDRGQSSLSSRDIARSARRRPSVWQRAQ